MAKSKAIDWEALEFGEGWALNVTDWKLSDRENVKEYRLYEP